jgi:hypothetical protein
MGVVLFVYDWFVAPPWYDLFEECCCHYDICNRRFKTCSTKFGLDQGMMVIISLIQVLCYGLQIGGFLKKNIGMGFCGVL